MVNTEGKVVIKSQEGSPGQRQRQWAEKRATQSSVNSTSQRGAEVQQVWGEEVKEHVQGRREGSGVPVKIVKKGKELYTILYTFMFI